jgi:hypothetical protein
MTRINAVRKFAEARDSVAWGTRNNSIHLSNTTSALIFAAALFACAITVGCSSSDQSKPIGNSNPVPVMPAPTSVTPAPAMQAENKPVPKKVVRKKPATVNYADKTSGVTFEYPRRYAIETGDAATDLLSSTPVPMNFIAPGGVALAAVELPETGFANTDFSSAFFNVSVNKTLTADQCSEFAVPQTKSSPVAPSSTEAAPVQTVSTPPTETPAPEAVPTSDSKPTTVTSEPQGSKLMLGDLELRGTEAVAGEGTRQSDSKYFHIFQNGACYEFGLNVTTVASEEGVTKHVDRDKVFDRLEKILATVKINPVTAPTPEVTAATPTTAATPAQ